MHVDYSSLGPPQRLKPYSLPHTLRGAAVTAAPPPLNLKAVPAAEADRPLNGKKSPPSSSSSGFLLMDSSLSTILFNAEAIQILSYPGKLPNARRPDAFLAGKVRSGLIRPNPSGESPIVTEYRSGRRRYLCRAFLVDTPDKGPSHARIAVLLERGSSALIALTQVSQQFNLTGREREALEYLVQGLSSKEIADRMNISFNTVKTFLRLIMIKMGVSSRMAVVRKIITTKP
jgi:DNA-binding CsgD family transcriptional regulator